MPTSLILQMTWIILLPTKFKYNLSRVGLNITLTIELGEEKGSVGLWCSSFDPLKARPNGATMIAAFVEDTKTNRTQPLEFMQNRLGMLYRYNAQLHA